MFSVFGISGRDNDPTYKLKIISTHPIMETTSYSLSFNPNLPFTCFTIPWWTDMMPFLHSKRIIQSKTEKKILKKNLNK